MYNLSVELDYFALSGQVMESSLCWVIQGQKKFNNIMSVPTISGQLGTLRNTCNTPPCTRPSTVSTKHSLLPSNITFKHFRGSNKKQLNTITVQVLQITIMRNSRIQTVMAITNKGE